MPTGKKLSDQEVAEIIRRYKRGEPVKKIARDFGVSVETIERRRRMAGVPPHPKKPRRTLTPLQEQSVINEYRSGKTMQQVAKVIGTTEAIVKLTLQRCDVPRRDSQEYRRVSKEKVEEAIERYRAGERAVVIAADLGVAPTTVHNYLKKAGVPIHNPELLNRSTPEQEQQSIELYNEGLTIKQVAQEIGINESLVLRILTRHNIPRRDSNAYRETFTFDEHFFDEVDTEEKAYMLGFLYADGCLLQDKYFSIRLNQHEKDKPTLEKFQRLLSSTYKLYRFETLNQWCLQVPSEHMWRRLKELGCPPKKTFKLKYPTWMPRELENHFIRGYFDGDGTIGFYDKTRSGRKKSHPKVAASLLSTPDMCDGIAHVLERETGNRPSIYLHYQENGEISKLGVGGPRLTLTMMDFLYRDATIYMKRKHAIYLRVRRYCDWVDLEAEKRKKCSKCGKKTLARNLCRKHYVEWKRSRTDRPECKEEGCVKVAYCRKMCEYHYNKWRFEGADRPRCKECNKPAISDGRCQFHYKQKRKRGPER